jgi:signal transduction histidine kinase
MSRKCIVCYVLLLCLICCFINGATERQRPTLQSLRNAIEALSNIEDEATFNKKYAICYQQANLLKVGEDVYKSLERQRVGHFYDHLKIDSLEKYLPSLKAYYRRINDPYQYYYVCEYLADAYSTIGDVTHAVELSHKMFNEGVSRNEPIGIAFGAYSIAISYYIMNDYKSAIPYFEKAIPKFYKLKKWGLYMTAACNYMGALIEDNNLQRALKHFIRLDATVNASLRSKHPFITPDMMANVKGIIAPELYLGLKRPDKVKKYLAETIEIYRRYPNIPKESLYQAQMIYAESTKDYQSQIVVIDKLLSYYRSLNDKSNMVRLYKNKSDAYRKMGQYQPSLTELDRYVALKDSIDNQEAQNNIQQFASFYKIKNLELDKKDLQLVMRNHELKFLILFTIIISMFLIGIVILAIRKHRLNITLKKALIVKDDFIHHINHEIRTPMNYMIGFIDLIIEKTPQTYESAKMIDYVHQGRNELLKMFDDMLLASDLEAGKKQYTFKPINLKSICEKTIMQIKPALPSDVALSMEYDFPSATINSNETGIQYILYNILHNAAKFTQKGYIHVKCSENDDNKVLISVTNNGQPIELSEQDKIFERFYKSSEFNQGLGLGLTNARKIAQLMNGNLLLNTTNTTATEFIITLPAA